MKRRMLVLLACMLCCSVLAARPAAADVRHGSENLNASCDYVIFSPEFSTARNTWEIWMLGYRSGNRAGSFNYEKDQCVSASLLSLKNPAAASGKIEKLTGTWRYTEDMLSEAGIRYYMFSEFGKPCYLAAPGGENTEVSPLESIEFQETWDSTSLLIGARGSMPGYMLLCQLWRNAGDFRQIPAAVTKTYGMDNVQTQSLYSYAISDYYTNEEQLRRYCDSLIPEVDYVSSSDTQQKHFSTDLYYRTGIAEMDLSPSRSGLMLMLTSPK